MAEVKTKEDLQNNAKSASPLLAFSNNVASQFGEDGILQAIFEAVGVTNSFLVDCGAGDGNKFSNSWNLVHEKKWGGILIEADSDRFEKLKSQYLQRPDVSCAHLCVGWGVENSLDQILFSNNSPKYFDFLSIDIDGNDYHVWDAMKNYRPRVVVIEFNPTIPADVSFVQEKREFVFQGSSLFSICELARNKGYELVAVTLVNAIFVEKELFLKFNISDNSPLVLKTDISLETRLFQLYDGTIKITGCKRLFWHNIDIDEAGLQILPRSKRIYPGAVTRNTKWRQFKIALRRSRVGPFLLNLKKISKILYS